METAGTEDMPDEAERRGLGTPATRAGVIERLVKAGLIERNKRNLIPTDKGMTLIAVLPEALTSAKLTSEWEQKLSQIESGTLDSSSFMDGITQFVTTIVQANKAPKPEYQALFSDIAPTSKPLGNCPRCGLQVHEGKKGFFCAGKTCGFKIWRESKFWTNKRKPLTTQIVTALLRDKRARLTGLYSTKTGKTYDATVVLDDTGDGFVNFKLEFDRR
jgi:DNA topoisomerase-3